MHTSAAAAPSAAVEALGLVVQAPATLQQARTGAERMQATAAVQQKPRTLFWAWSGMLRADGWGEEQRRAPHNSSSKVQQGVL